MKKETTAIRLRKLMDMRGIKQVDIYNAALPIADRMGMKIHKSDISQYLSGKVEPMQDKLSLLAEALRVNPVWLMGLDVPISPETKESPPDERKADSVDLIANEIALMMQRLKFIKEENLSEKDRHVLSGVATTLFAHFCE